MDGDLKKCVDLLKSNKIHRVIVEDIKTSTFTGYITYEAIFEYFITNYYSDMFAFKINFNQFKSESKKIITVDKNETIYNCLLSFWNNKISILPVVDGNDYFGFFFLKDIVYFFSNGDKFSFTDPISKFLIELYDGVESEMPYGRERIVISNNNDHTLKEIFEMMAQSPERKIILNTNEIITISDLFRMCDKKY